MVGWEGDVVEVLGGGGMGEGWVPEGRGAEVG